MSQRYFLTAESTYESLRQSLNTALAYPNSLGKSVFQTALYAPRDTFRRVLLAVDTDLPGYSTIAAAIAPLLDSDAMEEIDEATYLAALATATGGGGTSTAELMLRADTLVDSLSNGVVNTLIYENVISDPYSAYDSTTGIFTVPEGKGGIYAMQIALQISSSAPALAGIGDLSAYGSVFGRQFFTEAMHTVWDGTFREGRTAFIELEEGEELYIAAFLYNTTNDPFSAFNGFSGANMWTIYKL